MKGILEQGVASSDLVLPTSMYKERLPRGRSFFFGFGPILVMGPGGYRFRDDIIVGLPLTLIVFVIIMVLVPLLWPLQP